MRPDDPDFPEELVKAAFKEAMQEWLDAKYTALGKWTARGLAAALVTGLLYLLLTLNGWHRIP